MSNCSFSKKTLARTLLAGLVGGVIINLVMILTWSVLFKDLSQEQEFSFLFRDFRVDPKAKLIPLFGIIFGLVLALVYAWFYKAICCCNCKYSRGLWFGFVIWLITGFSGGLNAYGLYPYTIEATLVQIFSNLVAVLLASIAISKIYGDSLDSACGSTNEDGSYASKGGSCNWKSEGKQEDKNAEQWGTKPNKKGKSEE
jgi:hypothetical protein